MRYDQVEFAEGRTFWFLVLLLRKLLHICSQAGTYIGLASRHDEMPCDVYTTSNLHHIAMC